MEVRYIFLARYAEIDANLGTFAAMGGGVDTLFVPSLPHYMPTLYVVTKTSLDREDLERPHGIRVRLLKPDGEQIIESEEGNVPAGDVRPPNRQSLLINMLLVLHNLLFQTEGVYRFQLLYDGEVAKETMLRLEQQPPAPQPRDAPAEGGAEQ